MKRICAPVLLAALSACLPAGVVLATGFPALAQTLPQPGPGDPRIRYARWDENAVIALRTHMGYQMMIEFAEDERIENVSIGDSLSWQVTPNRKATLLFVKPVASGMATNMSVVTSLRSYSFELTSGEARGPSDPSIVYNLRFTYPPPPPPPPAPPAPPPKAEEAQAPRELNFAYRFKGPKSLQPVRVFDDGRLTYFEFSTQRDAPALFVLGPNQAEELANTRAVGRYISVDRTASHFLLRYGKQKLEVVNDGWVETALTEAPTAAPSPPAAPVPPEAPRRQSETGR